MTLRNIGIAGVGSILIGWSLAEAQTPASYMYTLMVEMVGPAAKSLWDLGARGALRDQDWERLRQDATRLKLLTENVSFGGTTLAEEQRAKSQLWRNWAVKFSDGVSAVNLAVDHRDHEALRSANATLEQACAGCHTAFPSRIY